MKKVMFAVLLMSGTLCSVVSFGQEMKANPEARAKKISEAMKKELSLTDSQYIKVYDINLKYAGKAHELRKTEGDRQSKMQEMKGIGKDKNDELKTVLTDAQWSQYKELQKQKRQDMKDKRKRIKTS